MKGLRRNSSWIGVTVAGIKIIFLIMLCVQTRHALSLLPDKSSLRFATIKQLNNQTIQLPAYTISEKISINFSFRQQAV